MFVQTWGHFLPLNTSVASCKTRNRILLYALRPRAVRLIRHICPTGTRDNRRNIHMFSDEWASYVPADRQNPSFLVEFVAQEPGSMAFKWLEVSKPSTKAHYASPAPPSQSFHNQSSRFGCAYGCPELNACISATLWCDGHRNCPSGVDEADLNCHAKWPSFKVLRSYGLPVVGLGLAGVVFAVLACIYCRRDPDYKQYDPETEPAAENTRSCSTIASS
jgi:hypothetical protein